MQIIAIGLSDAFVLLLRETANSIPPIPERVWFGSKKIEESKKQAEEFVKAWSHKYAGMLFGDWS